MFVHFNLSTFNNIEWVDPSVSINTFSPTALSVAQWVAVAQSAKVKYACLVAKHHDGFCLWPSKTSARNISNTSWYAANGQIDIVSEFITQFTAAGITPLIYCSIWDRWFELENPSFTQAQYQSWSQGIISELLGNYPPIGALWLDGTNWHFLNGNPGYPWASSAIRNSFIRGFQPSNIVVVDNNHIGTITDTDILEFEGGQNGGSITVGNPYPAEYITTIRGDLNWFWKAAADTPLTAAAIVSTLASCNLQNSSFMLNVPPDTTGTIPSQTATIMSAVGAIL
jgi:alpha-L-fucosidase